MSDPTTSTTEGPLAGIRVLEQGAFITGPFASMLLADMGAEVIKVERPGTGDAFRSYDGTGYASTFCSVNRNKQSVTIDHASPEDQQVLDDLVAGADVYLHNFRPGVAEKLQVGHERLMRINPRLVYCAISGLGGTGPYAGRPAYDTVAQAYSGLLSLTLDPTRPRVSGPAAADAVTALYAAQGILGALVRRGIDGRGHLVEISMLEAVSHFLVEPYSSYFGSGEDPGPYGRAAVSQSFAMRCSDEHLVALHLSSPPKFWLGLLRALDLEELGEDPRFADHQSRVRHHEELRIVLQGAFELRPRADLLDTLEANDVPHAPVLAPSEAVEDPQFRHLQLSVEATHPVHGRVRSIRPPHRFDHQVRTRVAAPPDLGEHDEQIRAALPDRVRASNGVPESARLAAPTTDSHERGE